MTEAQIVLLENQDPPRGNFDLKHLQALHKFLFGNIYDWAGEIRTAGFISKGKSVFCHSDFIVPYAQSLFSRMHREDFRKMTREQCAKRMAFYLSEVNALHPFREGNGRTTRLFFEIFAKTNGWDLCFAAIPHDEFVEAMIESMSGFYGQTRDHYRKSPYYQTITIYSDNKHTKGAHVIHSYHTYFGF